MRGSLLLSSMSLPLCRLGGVAFNMREMRFLYPVKTVFIKDSERKKKTRALDANLISFLVALIILKSNPIIRGRNQRPSGHQLGADGSG